MYLESETIDSLDDFAKYLALSRSQIIRDVLDRVAREYRKLLSARLARHGADNPLLEMIGFAHGGKSNLAETVDDIYRKDRP